MTHNLTRWLSDVLQEAIEEHAERRAGEEEGKIRVPPRLTGAAVDDLEEAFTTSKRRLIVLGFSGTLMPRNEYFHPNILSSARLPAALLSNLDTLASDFSTDVIVLSSVSQAVVARALDSLPCWLIAEGGVMHRPPVSGAEWHGGAEEIDTTWMTPVEDIME